MTMFQYHVVIRPPLDTLPSIQDIHAAFQNLQGRGKYSICPEKGKSDGPETHNHYDCTVELPKWKRADSLKRTLMTMLDIPKDKSLRSKVYEMDDDLITYYRGYSFKEEIPGYITNFDQFERADALEEYHRRKDILKQKDKEWKPDQWNIDDVAKYYRDWLLKNFDHDGVETHNAEMYIVPWLQENRVNVKFSVWQKINKEKLIEYVSGK